jgi:hypothetical protein
MELSPVATCGSYVKFVKDSPNPNGRIAGPNCVGVYLEAHTVEKP